MPQRPPNMDPIFSNKSPGPAAGLYVHVPFCRSKCPYCGFFSVPSSALVPAWMTALEKEARHYRGRDGRFDTLYLGGGTPSVLPAVRLERIREILFSLFDIAPGGEFTIEANPCDLTREKARALRDMGFNRVSVGVQSFDDAVLSFLGRRHTGSRAERALDRLRAAGFQNIGVDLMYGIPGLGMKQWRRTLSRALAFDPEHISCYQLTVEKKTPFARLRDRGEMEPMKEPEAVRFFIETARFLEARGYIHYEVSNFARGEAFISRHNRKYWHHVPYLGLGPSAHSFSGASRWWNVRSVRQYCRMLKGGALPVAGRERLSADQLRLEAVSLGARTRAGFRLKGIGADPGTREALMRLVAEGFLRLTGDRAVPTRKGFLVADRIPLHLGIG